MNYSPIASGSYGCVFLPGLRDNNNNRPKSNILSKVLINLLTVIGILLIIYVAYLWIF